MTPLAYEPFVIAATEHGRDGRAEVQSFCKTGNLPYDLYVKAALIVFQHHLRLGFTVTSDQGDVDWSRARDLVQAMLGYGQAFRLSPCSRPHPWVRDQHGLQRIP